MANNVKYETILSNFDGKITLLQFLKKVEEELGRAPTTDDLDALKDALELQLANKADASALADTTYTAEYALQQATTANATNDAQQTEIDDHGQRIRALEDAPAGGTQLYRHLITITTNGQGSFSLYMVSTTATAINSASSLYSLFSNSLNASTIVSCNVYQGNGDILTGGEKVLFIRSIYGELAIGFISGCYKPADTTGLPAITRDSFSSGVASVTDSVTAL